MSQSFKINIVCQVGKWMSQIKYVTFILNLQHTVVNKWKWHQIEEWLWRKIQVKLIRDLAQTRYYAAHSRNNWQRLSEKCEWSRIKFDCARRRSEWPHKRLAHSKRNWQRLSIKYEWSRIKFDCCARRRSEWPQKRLAHSLTIWHWQIQIRKTHIINHDLGSS